MGFRPPPLPPTQREWDERWNAGARTWRELDPEFAEWVDSRNNYGLQVALCAGFFLFTVLFCALAAFLKAR
jgi:hypothetical protein